MEAIPHLPHCDRSRRDHLLEQMQRPAAFVHVPCAVAIAAAHVIRIETDREYAQRIWPSMDAHAKHHAHPKPRPTTWKPNLYASPVVRCHVRWGEKSQNRQSTLALPASCAWMEISVISKPQGVRRVPPYRVFPEDPRRAALRDRAVVRETI
jgi:hypothetical protein